jgi:amino acid adenylation domain-containing protein
VLQLLSQIVEQSAQRRTQNVAFRCRDRSLTYTELNDQASQLAALLQKFGVQPGDRVAIYMPKAVEMAVSVYGCLKAGAIYVPVDPTLPTSRLKYVLDDAGVVAILTLDRQRKQLGEVWPKLECKPRVVVGLLSTGNIDAAVIPWDTVDAGCSFIPPTLSENDPAYIIYTSGSTGEPKGILHTHRSGLAYGRLAAETYEVSASDRLGNFAPLHFDQSTFEFFSGPLVGATTVLIPEEHMRFPASLAKLIDDERLTIWYSVPFALVQLLLRGALETRDLSSLRWVLYGGEPFPVGHLRELMKRLPAATFSNVYGPAEVNQCTYFNLTQPPKDTNASIPIGRIWPETTGLIVDQANLPVARGEIGELLINSSTMMPGYWNRPELTARVMVDVPHNENSLRFFRTGDLVRELEDGNLEFHGRSDRQVKIRGNRVELDEIEAVILRLQGVLNVAAFAPFDPATNDRRIVVAAILSADMELSSDQIQSEARKRLPTYAVPSEVVITETFPQTTSSKTDYIALETQFAATTAGGVV